MCLGFTATALTLTYDKLDKPRKDRSYRLQWLQYDLSKPNRWITNWHAASKQLGFQVPATNAKQQGQVSLLTGQS